MPVSKRRKKKRSPPLKTPRRFYTRVTIVTDDEPDHFPDKRHDQWLHAHARRRRHDLWRALKVDASYPFNERRY
jgi:hypothetical protein